MSLKGILSISGMGGLYKVVAQTKSGFIVESLIDEKRTAVSSTQKISMLEDISVYTIDGDIKLREVFLKMKEHEAETAAMNPKADNNTIRDFFSKVLPEYDAGRVYVSDIQKILKWFQMLHEKVSFEEEKEGEEENASTETAPAENNSETASTDTTEAATPTA